VLVTAIIVAGVIALACIVAFAAIAIASFGNSPWQATWDSYHGRLLPRHSPKPEATKSQHPAPAGPLTPDRLREYNAGG